MVDSRIMADLRETTLAESAVAEPEIELEESSKGEPEIEPDESGAVEGDKVEAGCPITMGVKWMVVGGDPLFGDPICGRKLHVAQDRVDEEPVCLMHSKDLRKQSGPLFVTFLLEFERVLKDAGAGEAHFESFVFPQIDFRGREFHANCRFIGATFTQGADFKKAIFKQIADFWGATFEQESNFTEATFTEDANFRNATFTQNSNSKGPLTQGANFINATFMSIANFVNATFTKDAYFYDTTFTQDADFREATFRRNAHFGNAIFKQAAHFSDTKFYGTADWYSSRFLDRAEFRCTKFDHRSNANFVQASFSKPGEVVFDDVDLSRALFRNCDVSQIWFTASVRWAKREGSRGIAVFDETTLLEHAHAELLNRDGPLGYREVEQLYRQLKKNYDSRLDYWTANELHFGEMEMKRLAVILPGGLILDEWLRWWQPRLGLVALYRYASDYGNSFWRPVLWLLATLALFAFLLPLPGVGLKRQGARQAETYASVWRAGDAWTPNLWAEARLAGKGAITSVDAATFQKSSEYAPAYPWGRVFAIFENLLTSTLFALFLLAIRRQFRR